MIESLYNILIAMALIAAPAAVFGLLLGFAATKFAKKGNPMVDKINQLLPQTQCGQCGYPGCKPYATAIATQDAPINLCPPGGESTIEDLAALLGKEPISLAQEEKLPSIAVIDEDGCIGCTLCIKACPVDAILGAAKLMHTVISDECTGCELCLEPCPVDVISMQPIATDIYNWTWPKPHSQKIVPLIQLLGEKKAAP